MLLSATVTGNKPKMLIFSDRSRAYMYARTSSNIHVERTRSSRVTRTDAGNWQVYEEVGSTEYESGEKIAVQETSLGSESVTCSVCKACMKARRRKKNETAAKKEDDEGYDEENQIQGRMNAENRWWSAELLAADCEKAWLHAGWEETMQKWYDWLGEMKNEDEISELEGTHQRTVSQMIKIAER